MKILIAADIFPPQTGGPATYSVAIANELTKHGVDVGIVSLNPKSDKTQVTCKIKHTSSNSKIFRYIEYFGLLLQEAKNYDIIYAMGPVNAGLPSLIAGMIRRKKVVTKVVGDYAWEQGIQRFGVKDLIDPFQKKTNYSFKVQVLKKIESFVVKNVDQVIVPSNYLKSIVTGWGAKPDNVTVVYNAVHLSKAEQKNHPNEKWIVSVARLVPWKGMEVLIDAFGDIRHQVKGSRLKIIGGGPELEKLKKKVKDQYLDSVVELIGNLPREQALTYLASSDVFVLNSAYEGLSHVLLEALSFDRLIIASNAGGNPEIIKPGETGELFDYNNKEQIKEKLLSALKGEMKSPTKNEDFFRQFTFDRMFSQTKQTLEKICKN